MATIGAQTQHRLHSIWAAYQHRAVLLGAGALLCAGIAAVPAGAAFADDMFTAASFESPITAEIQALEKATDEAQASADKIESDADEVATQVKDLETKLEQQKRRATQAAAEQFKLKQDGYQLVDALLDSDSLGDFLKYSEYLARISEHNRAALDQTQQVSDELQKRNVQLQGLKKAAGKKADEAADALAKARKVRTAKQEAGVARAVSEGGLLDVFDDGVDWSASRDDFMAEWTPRIDAYLAGSPLAGQGSVFAAASWEYCVDPRWSPAISHIESSKGRLCIRPYNAWGWGAADSNPYGLAREWGSWEEAIFAHVKGLSDGYGYTVSLSGAQKYCSGWSHWYTVVCEQMALI